MMDSARNPDAAVGWYDPDLIIRSAGDGSMSCKNKLSFSMGMQWDLCRVFCEVKMTCNRWAGREIGIED
tara:strand:- start:240 stop:446 length:207 start_codon:yes stop_codon:yes gene_type:complete